MSDQHYGRIVMTTSTGVLGLPTNTSYATAKARGHRPDPQPHDRGGQTGIKVNLIAPAAMTRMAGSRRLTGATMAPELVAPMAAFLAHEACPVSGEIYVAGAGRFACPSG